ncbi:hypothetical protein [Dactylosporangium sp. NPDC048998]|uniref:hypothetical protein n=1 Tax=Dactylosporangium sp. NPDC048998 TaxID=3363976 RepID=UPI0037186303
MAKNWQVGQCRQCLGWGWLLGPTHCLPCTSWRRVGLPRGTCRLCGHEALVNPSRECRVCTVAVLSTGTTDAAARQYDPPQLALVGPGLAKRIKLRRPPPHCAAIDDPAVCPPAVRGQLALFPAGRFRRLRREHARRIAGRNIADLDQALEVLRVHAEVEPTLPVRLLRDLLRLILAVRDSEGAAAVDEAWLAALPRCRHRIAVILRGVGLLVPCRPFDAALARRPAVARSCTDCSSWGFETTCAACTVWRKSWPAVGRCPRCGQDNVHLDHDGCRRCRVDLRWHAAADGGAVATQLWLGGTLAPRVFTHAGVLGYRPDREPPYRSRVTSPGGGELPVSRHLLDPSQLVLYDGPREWRTAARAPQPALTDAARRLMDRFEQHWRHQLWSYDVHIPCRAALRLAVGWLGADVPFTDLDLAGLRHLTWRPSLYRLTQFLTGQALYLATPRPCADTRAVERMLAEVPASFAGEVRRWVAALRGRGQRPRPPLAPITIRRYLHLLVPILATWGDEFTTLREVTHDDIVAALHALPRQRGHGAATALRSLFGALRQERVVFRDPARRIRVGDRTPLPKPLPSDRLAGLLDAGNAARVQLCVALLAVHALTPAELRHLRLADVDFARGRITVHRPGGDRIVYLDRVTHRIATVWLQERRRRWPTSANPHLIITGRTAHDRRHPPVTNAVLFVPLRRLGVHPTGLRTDRILHEAAVTADPVRLIHLFGIEAGTAMRYLRAAHPHRLTGPR